MLSKRRRFLKYLERENVEEYKKLIKERKELFNYAIAVEEKIAQKAEQKALKEKLEAILKDPEKIKNIIKDEFAEIKEKFGGERKTEIIPNAIGKFSSKDTIPNLPMILMLSKENYIKRIPTTMFKSQKRGGKGVIGVTTKEEDEIKIIRHAMNYDEILFFTNKGRVFKLPVYEVPQASRQAKGQPVVNLLNLQDKETVTSILIEREQDGNHKYYVMGTKKGTIKKTAKIDFNNVRKSGLIAIKLRPDDSLQWVKPVSDGGEIVMITKLGKCIRFDQKNVRAMGRASMGVRGIKLANEDKVVEMDVIKDTEIAKLLVIMQNGLGKFSKIINYRKQTRGGKGVKTAKITEKTGEIIGAKIVENKVDNDLIVISKHGQIIRLPIKNIPTIGRATQGVRLMRMKENDKVASISIIDKEELKERKQDAKEQEQKSLLKEEKVIPIENNTKAEKNTGKMKAEEKITEKSKKESKENIKKVTKKK